MTSNATHKATTALATIRQHWAASEAPPRPAIATTGNTPPKSKPPAPQLILRGDIITTLDHWTVALIQARPDLTPNTTDGPLELGNVRATSNYLQDHLDDIDEWGYLATFTREIVALAAQLTDLVEPPGTDRPALGECHLLTDGTTPTNSKTHQAAPRCGGTVRAVPARDPDTGTTSYTEARCNRCHTPAVIDWWRTQWRVDNDLVTTTELVKALRLQGIRTTPATVRWWLHAGVVHASGSTPNGDRLWDVPLVVMALSLRDQRGRGGGSVGAQGTGVSATQPAKVGH